jgi:maltooligosyltrehalose synthase
MQSYKNNLVIQFMFSVCKHLIKYEDKILPMINDSLDEIPSNYKTIIEHFKYLKQIIEWKMRMTPKQLRQYKVDLRNAKALIIITQETIQSN